MDFFQKKLYNNKNPRSFMNIDDCINFVIKTFDPEMERTEKDGYIYLTQEKHTYRLYQKNNNLIIQCALGPKLEQDTQTSYLLSELLQFNLKRMQVLDEILLLDPELTQLFLQKTIDMTTLTEEQLRFQWEDFTLNTEVIENKFFTKK